MKSEKVVMGVIGIMKDQEGMMAWMMDSSEGLVREQWAWRG